MQQFINYVKQYFRGVWYMLSGQWGKAWDLAGNKVAKSSNDNNKRA